MVIGAAAGAVGVEGGVAGSDFDTAPDEAEELEVGVWFWLGDGVGAPCRGGALLGPSLTFAGVLPHPTNAATKATTLMTVSERCFKACASSITHGILTAV